MTAASFPSRMMSTSITDEFCGAAYAFWEEICWKPAAYGEWWKHVSCMCQKTLNHLLRKAVDCEASQSIAYSFDVLSKDKALTYTVFKNN